MKIITLISVIGIMLLQFSGAVPQSSVGGPLTLALGFFAAALAVAVHEAWSARRGVLGWVVNIVVTFVGSFAAAEAGNLLFELLLPHINLQGMPLAASGHYLLYVSLAAMMLLILFGAWLALQIVNRWR